jgi:hypothetical protein
MTEGLANVNARPPRTAAEATSTDRQYGRQ